MLEQQFIYDEIEAEVNLCFDQLIFLLSNKIFAHAKNAASSLLIDKAYKGRMEFVRGRKMLSITHQRFAVPVSQHHIQLLGRSIDLNFLITQYISELLRQNIDKAISRFEARLAYFFSFSIGTILPIFFFFFFKKFG